VKFTMLSRRETISSPAHYAIVDGDDLHITGSFEESEENSSTVANVSCHTRSFAIGNSNKAKVTTNHSVDISRDDNIQDGQKGDKQFPKKSKKFMKILRKLGQSRRLLLLSSKFRQKSSLFRSSTNTVPDYEEIIENEFGHKEQYNSVNDSETILSLRSSRNNVRTGKSMLVRQKAQVISRPSTAHSNWEISQSHSSDSKSYRNLMLRGKSLVLDDSSIGGMSDMTEDTSSFYGFSNKAHLSFRRTPMFVNADTYCIDEDEDEDGSENDSEEKDSSPSSDGTIERAYDFRELSPLYDDVESTAEDCFGLQSPVVNEKQVTRLPLCDGIRKRVYSDSDIHSDHHHDILNTDSHLRSFSPSNQDSNFKDQKQSRDDLDQRNSRSDKRSDQRFSSSPCHGEEYIENNSSTPSRHVTAYDSWPFPRTRTYSDSYVDQIPINKEFQSPSKKHPNEEMGIQNCSALDTEAGSSINHSRVHNELFLDISFKTQSSRRQSLPLFESNEQNNRQSLRSRTYSDSVVHEKSVQEDIIWDPQKNSLEVVDTTTALSTKCMEGAFPTFQFGESPIASQARRFCPHPLHNEWSSPSTKTIDDEITHSRADTSSVLATLSCTNNHVADMFAATENRMPLQQPSVRNTSPAALRPAPAKRLPALPTQSPSAAAQQSDRYYWGSSKYVECPNNINKNDRDEDREIELTNLSSWSSESFDDIF